jgi:lysophospholipase L1-like esterase
MNKRMHLNGCKLVLGIGIGIAATLATLMVSASSTSNQAVGASGAAIEYLGRFDFSKPAGPRFAWSGSTIKARFSGTSATARIGNAGSDVNFTVVVDDGTPTVMKTRSGTTTTLTLASGLPIGEHTVLIARNSEAYGGTTQFLGFDFGGGTLLPPLAYSSSLKLEVYGDSISAGQGDVRINCSGSSVDDESAYLTYAAKATRVLGAQPPTIIAWSGKGILHNGNGAAANVDTIPATYDRAVGVEKVLWNFPADKVPHVVVIALGTNDIYPLPSGQRPIDTALTDAYLAFAKTLRARNPQASLVFAIGPMNYGYQAAALAAVAELNSSGDSNAYSLVFSPDKLPYGCDFHPSDDQHTTMANELVALLKKIGY